jgi:hypothetical protein
MIDQPNSDRKTHLAAWLRNSVSATTMLLAFAATALLGWFLWYSGTPLQTPKVPYRIMSLQLACDASHANEILNSWGTMARPLAFRQTLWDFLFIPAYSYLLFGIAETSARYARGRNRPRLARYAGYAGIAGLLAGGFDIFENFGLLTMLRFDAADPVPLLTSVCAVAKFLLIGIALVGALAISAVARSAKISRPMNISA